MDQGHFELVEIFIKRELKELFSRSAKQMSDSAVTYITNAIHYEENKIDIGTYRRTLEVWQKDYLAPFYLEFAMTFAESVHKTLQLPEEYLQLLNKQIARDHFKKDDGAAAAESQVAVSSGMSDDQMDVEIAQLLKEIAILEFKRTTLGQLRAVSANFKKGSKLFDLDGQRQELIQGVRDLSRLASTQQPLQ